MVATFQVNICREAEASVFHKNAFSELSHVVPYPLDATHSTAIAAVKAAHNTLAAAVICITTSGRSAHLVSKYRPRCPIVAVTRLEQTARQCHLWRGVIPCFYKGLFCPCVDSVPSSSLAFFVLDLSCLIFFSSVGLFVRGRYNGINPGDLKFRAIFFLIFRQVACGPWWKRF